MLNIFRAHLVIPIHFAIYQHHKRSLATRSRMHVKHGKRLKHNMKYLLILGVLEAVVGLWTIQTVSSSLRFYDVTEFKLHWKVCDLEIRVYYHVTVGDWVPDASNDRPRLHVQPTASLRKEYCFGYCMNISI